MFPCILMPPYISVYCFQSSAPREIWHYLTLLIKLSYFSIKILEGSSKTFSMISWQYLESISVKIWNQKPQNILHKVCSQLSDTQTVKAGGLRSSLFTLKESCLSLNNRQTSSQNQPSLHPPTPAEKGSRNQTRHTFQIDQYFRSTLIGKDGREDK